MSIKPFFSVVIPLFNKANLISKTLRTVLSQTFEDFEIVIIDDGSTDNSHLAVTACKDHRIRLIRQKNGGVSAARNRGITEALGDFIAFLDADDEWDSEYLSTMRLMIEKYPECHVFASRYRFKYAQDKIADITLNNVRFDGEFGIMDNYFEIAAHSSPPLWTSAVVVSRKSILSTGGFPDGIKSGEDLLTWAKLALGYRIAYCNKPLAYFLRDETVFNSDQKDRKPEITDYVGNELHALLLANGDTKGLREYVSLWHKMRCRIYISKSCRKEARSEALKALHFDVNAKNLVFLALSFLPLSFSNKIINRLS